MRSYRKNLINYWRQYYPDWEIPKGYHVHHIKPKSLGGTDEARNLIALHPDDHVSIHLLRGDRYVKGRLLTMKNYKKTRQHINNHRESLIEFHKNNPDAVRGENNGMYGKKHKNEWKLKRSKQQMEYAKSLTIEERKEKWASAKNKKWYVFEDGTIIYSKDRSEDKFKTGIKYKNGRKW